MSELPPPPTVVNLTPHDVVVWLDDDPMGVKMRFPASGDVARLGTIPLGTQYYPQVGVPVELVEFHHLENPPPREDGTWYIVSLPTALASPRSDFLVPYREVRDDDGRIVGCRMLARPAHACEAGMTRRPFAPLVVSAVLAWSLWGIFDALGWW